MTNSLSLAALRSPRQKQALQSEHIRAEPERQSSRSALNYIFCKPLSPLRSRSTTLHSSLRSRSIVFRDLRSSLRSRSPDFWPAPLPVAQPILNTVRHCSRLFIMIASPFYPNKFIYLVSMCNIINKDRMFVKYTN